MFGIVLALLLAGVLYAVVETWGGKLKRELHLALMGGYVLRLVVQSFVRNFEMFTSGLGGDNFGYEAMARTIVSWWSITGVHYVAGEEIPGLDAHTTLPPNLFALVFYLNGEPTRLGATALVALAACLACLNLYSLGVELGADERFAFRVMLVSLFGPGFVFYTADTFKDGFVVLFAVSAVCAGFRLSQKISVLQAAIGLISLLALWQVRHYLIMVCAAPFIVGAVGLRSKSSVRPVLVALGLCAVMIVVVAYTDLLTTAQTTLTRTYDVGTSALSRDSNATGGSGVTFEDDGRATGALHLKLLYTLFAPFPWQGGSLGLQIGKIDVLIWYVLAWWAYRAGRDLLKTRPGLLPMFLVFLVPASVMYALTMANVGLVHRQRLPVLLVASVLAMLRRPKTTAPATAPLAARAEPALALARTGFRSRFPR